MWLLPALWLFSASPAPSPVWGVASAADGSACARFAGPVRVGAPVSLVFPHSPQRVARATVGPSLGAPCRALANADLSGPFQSILEAGDPFEPSELAIAVAGGLRTSVEGEQAIARSRNGSARYSFRTCTSNEGVHLTVWAGEPLANARVWHEYVYLGYDVEPSCVPRDYEK